MKQDASTALVSDQPSCALTKETDRKKVQIDAPDIVPEDTHLIQSKSYRRSREVALMKLALPRENPSDSD